MKDFGVNPAGGRIGFRREFGDLGVQPDGGLIPGPGIQVIGMGPLGRAIIGAKKSKSSSISYPFDVSVSGTGTPLDVTLRPGTVNQLLPTNMFTPLSIPSADTGYVTLTIATAGGVV